MMSNTAQAAAEIRTTLKREHGWSSRQVSVKSDLYANGSSIRIVIKDAAVPSTTVERVAKAHEHVRYCEMSGEILSGGNLFVDVSYAASALAPLVEPLGVLLATVEADPGRFVELPGGWEAQKDPGAGDYWRAWRGETPDLHCWGRDFLAKQIAIANINASAVAS